MFANVSTSKIKSLPQDLKRSWFENDKSKEQYHGLKLSMTLIPWKQNKEKDDTFISPSTTTCARKFERKNDTFVK